jgi:hypothetical protein
MMLFDKVRHIYRKAKGKFVGYKDLDTKLHNVQTQIAEMHKEFERKCQHEQDEREILATSINAVRNILIAVRVEIANIPKKNG